MFWRGFDRGEEEKAVLDFRITQRVETHRGGWRRSGKRFVIPERKGGEAGDDAPAISRELH